MVRGALRQPLEPLPLGCPGRRCAAGRAGRGGAAGGRALRGGDRLHLRWQREHRHGVLDGSPASPRTPASGGLQRRAQRDAEERRGLPGARARSGDDPGGRQWSPGPRSALRRHRPRHLSRVADAGQQRDGGDHRPGGDRSRLLGGGGHLPPGRGPRARQALPRPARPRLRPGIDLGAQAARTQGQWSPLGALRLPLHPPRGGRPPGGGTPGRDRERARLCRLGSGRAPGPRVRGGRSGARQPGSPAGRAGGGDPRARPQGPRPRRRGAAGRQHALPAPARVRGARGGVDAGGAGRRGLRRLRLQRDPLRPLAGARGHGSGGGGRLPEPAPLPLPCHR